MSLVPRVAFTYMVAGVLVGEAVVLILMSLVGWVAASAVALVLGFSLALLVPDE